LTGFTVESWDTQLDKESGGSTLRGELEDIRFWLCLCVDPLRLGGLRGKKSTPSVGWEVQVNSSQLASGQLDGAQAWENIFELS
jgi:hypothetical protein